MTLAIAQDIDDKRAFGDEICQRIADHKVRLGFASPDAEPPVFGQAEFDWITDPYSQSRDLVGYWYDAGRRRVGQIKFHGDGSFYAEYDVLRPHPGKPRQFVEAIDAWGKPGAIKTEARLLEMPV